MKKLFLPLRSLHHHPARTFILALLVCCLAFSVFSGSVLILSLRNGLYSLENRMGADVIAVPSTAKSKTNLEQMLLQGTTGYFYMDREKLDQIQATSGVLTASPQLFLASLRASCCSLPVQVIGFDPETDFTVRPWIAENYSGDLALLEVAVGSKVSAGVGEKIRIYENSCPVVARLAPTGTGLDTAVYCSMETVRHLLDAARSLGHDLKISGDPEDVISAVYIRVADGYDPEKVAADISLHIRKVDAVQTKRMFTGVSDSLSGIAGTVVWLVAAVWLLALAILILVFILMTRARRREFAVLRLAGMSRTMLRRMVLAESLLCSLPGALAGVGIGAAVLFPFNALIESMLGLPYLSPPAGLVILLAAATLLLSVGASSLAAMSAAARLSRVDPGTTLREGA